MKLTIELVPKTSWYTNVRNKVSTQMWDRIRKLHYAKANHCCEICGDKGTNQGYRHDVECHEVWQYDDSKLVQTLTNMIALCPLCHKVKHIGLAQIKGEYPQAFAHFIKVNQCTEEEADEYITKAFRLWRVRSKVQWDVNVDLLNAYKIIKP